MPFENPPAYAQSGTYTARADRLYRTSIHNMPTRRSLTEFGARSGLLNAPAGRAATYAIASGMTVNVDPFAAIIENGFATNGGDYETISNSVLTVTHAASSTTQSRIDVVGVRIQDAFYSGSTTAADLMVVQGAFSTGTPVVPTLPATFMPIYQAAIGVNATTPVLTMLRRYTGPVSSVPSITTWQVPELGTYEGELRYWSGYKGFQQWDANANLWRAFGGNVFRNGQLLVSSGTFTTVGNNVALSKISLPDPGGIWLPLTAANMEITGQGRMDLVATLDAWNSVQSSWINQGYRVPSVLVTPTAVTNDGAVGQLQSNYTGNPITGAHEVWINLLSVFGPAAWTVLTSNFRTSALQVLLRMP